MMLPAFFLFSEMITSVQNKYLKSVSKLHRRKYRDLFQKTIIEGYRAIVSAIESNYPLETLLYCPPLFLGNREDVLVRQMRRSEIRMIEVSKEAFLRISGGGRPQGLIALAPIVCKHFSDYHISPNGFYLIVESIEKPGNLGSIMRSADSVGINAVFLCNPQADLYDPKCILASMGSVFSIPLLHGSTDQILSWCHQNSICIIAASPHATMVHTKANMKQRIAIAIGNEQIGLSKTWMDRSNTQVRIPMLGQADSLNVAAAATVLLYEAVRQKSES